MAVHGDGLARRPEGYLGLVPADWPSIRHTTGWQPPAESTEDHARDAVRQLIARHTVFCGRFCYACNADLSDPGAPRSHTLAGVKAATGQYPEYTLAIPQGGHAPDCPVPYLLRWLGEPESVYTRLRTHDIDDAAATIAVKAKSSMELVGTDLELLSPEEVAARKVVMKGFGYAIEPEEES